MTVPTPPDDPAAPALTERVGRAGRVAAAVGRERLAHLQTRARRWREERPAVPVYPAPAEPAFPAPAGPVYAAPAEPVDQAHVAPVYPASVVPAAVHHVHPGHHPVPYAVGGPVAFPPAGAPAKRPFHGVAVVALLVAFIFPPAGLRLSDRARTECRRENLRGQGLAMTAYLVSAVNTLGLTLLALAIGATFAVGMYKLGSGVEGIAAGLKSVGEFLDWVRRGFA